MTPTNVTAQATDSYADVGTSTSSTFTYGTRAPSVVITYPVNNTTYGTNWSGSISGTATANATGSSLVVVGVAIRNITTSKWWNGSAFSAVSPDYIATGTTSWFLNVSASHLTNGDAYSVTAQALDSAGNVGTSTSSTFTYSTTPPRLSVAFPVTGMSYNANAWTNGSTSPCGSSGTICGQATPTLSTISGTGSITLTLTQAGSPNLTWNGTSFASGSNTVHPTAYNSGNGLWTYTFANSHLTTGDSYAVAVTATDSAGNTSPAATSSFIYNTTTPTVTSVSTTTASGTYKTAATVAVTLTFSEPVTVTGTPKLTLNTSPSETAHYASGSGPPR